MQIITALVVSASALLFALRPLSVEVPTPDLDGSWMTVLGEAATRPLQWGVDIAYTYGPASALITRYFTDGYLSWALPTAVATALVFGTCFSRLAALAVEGRRRRTAMMLIAAGAEAAGLLATAPHPPDIVDLAVVLNIFLLDLARPTRDRISRVAVMAGACIMGVLALSKTSLGIGSLVLFVLSDAFSAVRQRRIPVLTPSFVLAGLAAFLCFGQRLTDIPDYLRLQGDFAAGYGEAMYIYGRPRELYGFLIASVLLVVVVALHGPADPLRRCITSLGFLAALLLVLKAGFVRQDMHTQIGWLLLSLAGLSAATSIVLERQVARAGALAAASLGVAWIVAPSFLSDEKGLRLPLGEFYRLSADDVVGEVTAWGAFLRSPAEFASAVRDRKTQALAEIRSQYPLPQLAGTVDILPSEQSSVLAGQLDYRARPSFQNYSTYAAGLVAANQAYYTGPAAPDWVLFGLDTLDGRYPASFEGALWPVLLARYEPAGFTRGLLMLHRRAQPLPDVLGPPQRLDTRIGQPMKVPAGAVFARIAVRKTLLGRLAAMIFRPPALIMRIEMLDRKQRSYRFIPAIAASGFLISPFVDNPQSFALIATGEGAALGGLAIADLVITGSPMSKLFYDPAIEVEFRSVELGGAAPGPEARSVLDRR